MTNNKAMNTPALTLSGLHKSFGTVRAVDGIDLSIAEGEVVALLGANGAGKTTTIDMILGLTRPDKGSIEVFGMSPRAAVDHGAIAAVQQTGGLLPTITVRETVELMASLYSNPLSADAALDRAGATEFADRFVSQCSGGQQQRLRFAMSLVSNPRLLILDEPTTGMDVAVRRDFWTAIHADAEAGRTIIFATHYLEEADNFADRIILLDRGRVIADGTPLELRSRLEGSRLQATATADRDTIDAALAGVEVTEVTLDHGTLTVLADDTDAVAKALLATGVARNLTISTHSLDDAFVALTSQQNSEN